MYFKIPLTFFLLLSPLPSLVPPSIVNIKCAVICRFCCYREDLKVDKLDKLDKSDKREEKNER